MERIYALIDKLCQQKKENVSPAHLLFTVQLLQTELAKLQHKNGSLGTSKVAVTLPVNLNFAEEVVRSAMASINEEIVIEPVKQETPKEEYFLNKPADTFGEEVKPIIREEPKPAYVAPLVMNPAFDAVEDNPAYVPYMPKKEITDYSFQPKKEVTEYTTYQPKTPGYSAYQPKTETQAYVPKPQVAEVSSAKEIHELIAVQQESLNDRLKEEKKELAHVLTASPIKDLRKAVGINDRFTFVTELFRGDNSMYERSIKTINEFNVFSEAEYWINRELKYKLGWNDRNETVQHFYQLVKRRFL